MYWISSLRIKRLSFVCLGEIWTFLKKKGYHKIFWELPFPSVQLVWWYDRYEVSKLMRVTSRTFAMNVHKWSWLNIILRIQYQRYCVHTRSKSQGLLWNFTTAVIINSSTASAHMSWKYEVCHSTFYCMYRNTWSACFMDMSGVIILKFILKIEYDIVDWIYLAYLLDSLLKMTI